MAEHEYVEDYDSPHGACKVEGCEEKEQGHPVLTHYFEPNPPGTACWATANTLGHPMLCGRAESVHRLGRAPRG